MTRFHSLAATAASALFTGAVSVDDAFAQSAASKSAGAAGVCTATAGLARRSCSFNARDDYYLKIAACVNFNDPSEKRECRADARAEFAEQSALCVEQAKARLDICGLVGEAAYDPPFDPRNFETNFRALMHPNKYFPLAVGNRWNYSSNNGETNVVEVTNRTKLIEGVTCVVVHDLVSEDGSPIEDTDDWFAQARDGAVWYCGEEVKDFETFERDNPPLPELVAIDGSFKAGRDNAKPGVVFLAHPSRGITYREEFAIGEAEDVSTVLTTTYSYGADPELDRLVPPALAKLLCRGDCIVTKAFAASQPGAVELKYFAAGIGTFLETAPDTGEVVQLVGCNFDPRCVSLPQP